MRKGDEDWKEEQNDGKEQEEEGAKKMRKIRIIQRILGDLKKKNEVSFDIHWF